MDSIPQSNPDWAAYISTIADQLPETFAVHPNPTPLQTAIARAIDHTLLAPDATEAQIDALCAEACAYRFAAVCVRLEHVARAAHNLAQMGAKGTNIACVVGFPSGMCPTAEKEDEAREAVRLCSSSSSTAAGAAAPELDMVLKYPLLKEGRYVEVYEDVVAVRRAAAAAAAAAAAQPHAKLKVILETARLSRDEIIAGTVIACVAGADFVKTSTGFNGVGATTENVALMRAVADQVGTGCHVKASGGIKTVEDAVSMLKAGADRIGTSAAVRIMQELAGRDE